MKNELTEPLHEKSGSQTGQSPPLNREECDSAAAHRTYWGKIAPKYDGVIETLICGAARDEVRARLGCSPPLGQVVEFGCGTGYNTVTLAANATSVIATDLSPGMLAVAQRRVQVANVSFQIADCRRPSFAPESFDTAVLGLVLHLVPPEAALRRVRRIVRPGGRIVIINPGVASLRRVDRFGCQCRMIYHGITRYRLKPPADFGSHLRTGDELCDLLEWNGWREVRLSSIPSSSRPFGIPLEYIEAVKKPDPAAAEG